MTVSGCGSESSGRPGAGSLGAPCQTSADCSGSLFCPLDSPQHVLDGQCSATCDSSNACDASLGPSRACIGANLCVRDCVNDSDCPAGTTCNDYQWCQRTHSTPVASGLRCAGVPLGCWNNTNGSDCEHAPGCYMSPACVGEVADCSEQSTCGYARGCHYDLDLHRCAGDASPCNSLGHGFTCENTTGCHVGESCGGIPTPCEELTATSCKLQPGCSLL